MLILFALVPAVIAFLPAALLFGHEMGLAVGIGVFGLGVDVLARGSGR